MSSSSSCLSWRIFFLPSRRVHSCSSSATTFTLSSADSDDEVAVVDVRIPPGGGPPMLHRQEAFELYRIRRGRLTVYREGRDGFVSRHLAGAGSVVPIEGGLEHTVRTGVGHEVEATVLFSPGEQMERFARAAGELGRDRAPAPADVIALAEAHGVEITRPIAEALMEAETLRPAYLTIARFEGDPGRLLDDFRSYTAAMAEVGRDHGLILHAATQTDDGMTIFNLWPSEERSEAAARDPRRAQVIERARLHPGQVRREHHRVEHFTVFG